MSTTDISEKLIDENKSNDPIASEHQSHILLPSDDDNYDDLNFYLKNSPDKFESILDYSNQLSEILYILNEDQEITSEERESVELLLIDLIQSPPYPNQYEQLSRILIDNFQSLNKMIIRYSNLEISSLINKFLVKLIYELNYWEIYHLLYFLPKIDYYLKLTNFDIIVTPFGPLVKPPENYYSKQMMEAYQYPFPYPYYNYSYHSFKPKKSTINIKPYDLPINEKPKKIRKPKEKRKEKDFTWTLVQGENGHEVHLSKRKSEGDNDMDEESRRKIRVGEYEDDENNDNDLEDHEIEYEYDENDKERPRRKYQTKPKSEVIHQCNFDDPITNKPCSKIFYGKNELLRHQEFVHATKKKIYKCIFCARVGYKVQSYPRHDSLARHIRRKHGVTGKENKKAVNFAKENVEIMDDETKNRNFPKTMPTPHMLNSDFTINRNINSQSVGNSSFISNDNSIDNSNNFSNNNSDDEFGQSNASDQASSSVPPTNFGTTGSYTPSDQS